MSKDQTRSEYRLIIAPGMYISTLERVDSLNRKDRVALAQLMLSAYRNIVDDEGETMIEALEAVDEILERSIANYSVLLKIDGLPVAMSIVIKLRGTYYIDTVVVAASHKRTGLGRRMVETNLASLALSGVTEVGATITDGNVPFERLFASLGAFRVGPWPPVST